MPPSRTVDRTCRNRLAQAIRDFAECRIGAVTFEDQIVEIEEATDDETVREIARLLWFYYDDIADQPAILSRDEWDYFQRLLLVLASNAHLIKHRIAIRTRSRWIARLTLVIAGIAAWRTGLTQGLYLVALCCGVVELILGPWQRRLKTEPSDTKRLAPFASVTEMLAVRRGVPRFRKTRYPDAHGDDRRQHPWLEWLIRATFTHSLWICSPLVLITQALPQAATRYSVELDAGGSSPPGGARG